MAGTGLPGFNGDGILATQAKLDLPSDVTLGSDGSLYIVDSRPGSGRVRRVDANGFLATVAGNDLPGFSGDGGPATAARLSSPCDVLLGPDGGFYIAEWCNHVIRRVGPDRIITTVAGDGIVTPNSCVNSFAGEGAPPTQAKLYQPDDLAFGPGGALVQGFLYQDRLRPIAELDGSGTVVSRFVYGSRATVPDYMIKGGVTYRIFADHLGSPRLVVDTTTGTVVQRMDYMEARRAAGEGSPAFQDTADEIPSLTSARS